MSMGEARRLMIQLATQLSEEQGAEYPSDEDWAEIKHMAHIQACELKHRVYGESRENFDKKNGWSSIGHDVRMDIYYDLKNAFFKKWNEERKKIEKKEGESK